MAVFGCFFYSYGHSLSHITHPQHSFTPLTSGMAKAKKEKESDDYEAKVNIEYVLSAIAVLIG